MYAYATLILLLLLLYVYCVYSVINSQPKLRDLYNLITPEYAAHWRVIGTLLGIEKGVVDEIELAYPINPSWCCNKLLERWLERDTNASWKKIIEVIDSSAMKTPASVG